MKLRNMKVIGYSKKYAFLQYMVIIGVLLFCEWFFFRNVLGEGIGKGLLIADRWDGRLTNLLTEHWWNYFCGKEKFSEIAMFYPAAEAIGYTDMFLGYGLIHSVFRLIGFNMFEAYKWTLILIHVFGTVTMFWLMHRTLRCSLFWSLFGTVAFSYSSTYARFIVHTQLAAISFLPLLMILLCGFFRNIHNRRLRNSYAYGFIVGFVLLTYTSWYVACFSGFFCLVYIIIYGIYLRHTEKKCFQELEKFFVGLSWDTAGYMAVLFILFIPFARIYIPVMLSTSGYSYGACAEFLPEIMDLINVHPSNPMLGWMIKLLGLNSRGYSFEVEEGFSIILLGVFCYMMWKMRPLMKAVSENKEKQPIVSGACLAYLAGLVSIICVLFIIRLSANGVALWIAVYYLIPVMRSVRAIARLLLWLSFPLSVTTAFLADHYLKEQFPSKALYALLCVVGLGLLFWSNATPKGVAQYWDAAYEYKFKSYVAKPPEDVKVFYITDTEGNDPPYGYQLDAYEIANWYGLKTLNGYSGQSPKDWKLWEVKGDDYEKNVEEWIRAYDLKDVYCYDRGKNTWKKRDDI